MGGRHRLRHARQHEAATGHGRPEADAGGGGVEAGEEDVAKQSHDPDRGHEQLDDEDDQKVAGDHRPGERVTRPAPANDVHPEPEWHVDEQDEGRERHAVAGGDDGDGPAQAHCDGRDGGPEDRGRCDEPRPEIVLLESPRPHPNQQFDAPRAKTCTYRGRLHP